MRCVAIVNQKGGCGKTTTAINLAATLASKNRRTLLVDMDPQGHCGVGLGVPEDRIEQGLAEALLAEPPGGADPDVMLWEVAKNLRLAPSTLSLAGLEAARGGLANLPDRDARLAKFLDRIADRFDWCVIDCPPTIGLLTFNALCAADEAIIPVETGFFSLKGSERQAAAVEAMAARLERKLPLRILPTLHRPHAKLATDLLAAIERRHGMLTLPLAIREHEELREAAGFGQPITEYAPSSEACRDFVLLVDWLDLHPVPCTRKHPGDGKVFRRELSAGETAPGPATAPGERMADLLSRIRQQSAGVESVNAENASAVSAEQPGVAARVAESPIAGDER
ncbi:MAG: ParA family protein [Planctomycetes bacterium]|nr:ParA family protein [Planctomycetota bacterium]